MQSLQQAKLVLLGEMGAGKSSLVLRFVKGQFFDYQVMLGLGVGSYTKGSRSFWHSVLVAILVE